LSFTSAIARTQDARAAIPIFSIDDRSAWQAPPALAGKCFAIGTLASLLVVAALLHATGLAVDAWSRTSLIIYGATLVTAMLWWKCRFRASRAERIVQDFAESLIAFSFVTLLGAIASYPMIALSHGFSDAVLAEADHLMRFNWVDWYDVTAAHPLLQIAGRFAYKCIFISPPVLLGYFAWTGRKAEARQFIAAFWLAAVVSLSIAIFLPAQGPLVYLWRGVVDYVPATAFYQADLIPMLRAHQVHVIDPGALRGLVSAPSFHTASAVIFIATAWPFRQIRWPLLIVNLTMLLATVVEGTHYLTDMLSGGVVAIFSIAAMATLTHWLGRERPSYTLAPAVAEPWPAVVV
jgi:membrane-associated phospholipid phosphatase